MLQKLVVSQKCNLIGRPVFYLAILPPSDFRQMITCVPELTPLNNEDDDNIFLPGKVVVRIKGDNPSKCLYNV